MCNMFIIMSLFKYIHAVLLRNTFARKFRVFQCVSKNFYAADNLGSKIDLCSFG